MDLDPESCYRALVTHDARFDGVFFVGVTSTGVYCRTVCPARRPRRENCDFYPSAAAAERAGFRPCRRCRPELAPGQAPADAIGRLAAAVAARLEEGALRELRVAELAAELGVSERHLRRVVRAQFGVSPVELAQTGRLLRAKRLLTDTELPVIEVAYASGFSSLRRFNALFRERYRLNPTDLRKRRAAPRRGERVIAEAAYRPPLEWSALLRFLAQHASRGVEAVDGDCYRRTVTLGEHAGWIAVEPLPERAALRVELSASLAPVMLPVLARVRRLFDLAADPERIAAPLGPLAAVRPGLRVPGAYDGFETAVRIVLGQQVSVAAGTTLMGRLVERFGAPAETPFTGLTRQTPAAEHLAAAEPGELAALGMPATRGAAVVALARAAAKGHLRLEPGGDPERTMRRLREMPGIGEWTAQCIAMRALAWPDAFPHGDLGLRQALGERDPRRILALAEAWRPWRAYATMHLWKSLEREG